LNLKRIYLNQEDYCRIVSNLNTGLVTAQIKNLIELDFIVSETYDQEKAFQQIANKVLRRKPDPALSYIIVTDFCNFKCGYCFLENAISEPRLFMSKQLADKVIRSIAGLAAKTSKYKVVFYGGEPLLNREVLFYIIENLELACKDKFLFSCVTNGSLIDENVAQEFKRHNVIVGLSLDGWAELDKNRKTADGAETFYSAIRGLSFLKEAGVNLGVSCTITKQNCLHAEEIVDFVYKLGVKSLSFNLLTKLENAIEYAVPDPKQLAFSLFKAFVKARRLGIVEDRIGRRRASYFFKEQLHVYDCPGYGREVFFSPTGTVGPCHAFYPSGKYQIPINENMRIDEEPLFYKFLEIGGTFKDKECMKCAAIGICGGACAYDVYVKTGTLGVKERYFCAFQNEILYLLLKYDFMLKTKQKLTCNVEN
jgi:uncharacterized protein